MPIPKVYLSVSAMPSDDSRRTLTGRIGGPWIPRAHNIPRIQNEEFPRQLHRVLRPERGPACGDFDYTDLELRIWALALSATSDTDPDI